MTEISTTEAMIRLEERGMITVDWPAYYASDIFREDQRRPSLYQPPAESRESVEPKTPHNCETDTRCKGTRCWFRSVPTRR